MLFCINDPQVQNCESVLQTKAIFCANQTGLGEKTVDFVTWRTNSTYSGYTVLQILFGNCYFFLSRMNGQTMSLVSTCQRTELVKTCGKHVWNITRSIGLYQIAAITTWKSDGF